jgi:hypothetical protein
VRIRGPRDLARLSSRSQSAFANAAEVVSGARRHGFTIAQEVDIQQSLGLRISVATVVRYLGHDLERDSRGALVPKPTDRSYHGDMRVTSTQGVLARPLRGSNVRRLVSEHASAVRAYLNGRDPHEARLREFEGKRAGGLLLETDPDQLEFLQDQGELDYLDLYVEVGG